MKIERINENQIRCTLSSFDLSVRNLNLGELAYGSEKARNLFREMIQKASNEVGFDAEDIPLMVEAIPLSNESVMLVITKIEDPEELDTRFSKFSQMADEDTDSIFGGIANEFLEGADGLMELLKQNLLGLSSQEGDSAPATPQTEDGSKAQEIQTRIYRFDSLDQVVSASKVAGHVYQGSNTLYKKPGSAQYYLVLSSADTEPLVFSRVCNILAEYGEKIRHQPASEAYYKEHYEVIVYQQALQKLMLV
ncbi:MAG: adaptor protein MecA [Lachnospiraceae bacterium]|nr:adaptor protein MecA [Lachnospiraceae bacterium]